MAISITKTKSGLTRKESQIETIRKLAEENSVIGIADLSGISSKAIQGIRTSLRSGEVNATLKVAKNTLKTIALEKLQAKTSKKTVDQFLSHINGSCALIFSNESPFKLQRFLSKNSVPAPAKAGQISPVEVLIPEGVTNLDPGPIISELGSIGLQTRIEKGKIRITKTAKVLSVGDTVSETHAAVLTRLGIQPFSVNLRISQVIEGDEVIDGSILEVDEDQIISDLQQAYMNAMALAVDSRVNYYSEESIPILLGNAVRQAFGLSIESNYLTKDNLNALLVKTKAQADTLKEKISDKDSKIEFKDY
ncbi:50S ribosomal protein L10 [Candidatus Heimdallarchaeota archaeon B3_Heim]|nr:MAG: 50S ribosomal protein L10 [Candidatus Heimdallarchaeota archaeon B3_Heim]